MDHPDLILCSSMGNSFGPKRENLIFKEHTINVKKFRFRLGRTFHQARFVFKLFKNVMSSPVSLSKIQGLLKDSPTVSKD